MGGDGRTDEGNEDAVNGCDNQGLLEDVVGTVIMGTTGCVCDLD